MRISDWSSDVCSADLVYCGRGLSLFHWARGRQTRPPARRRRRHGRCLLILQPFLLRFTGLGKIVDLSIIDLSKVKSMAATPAPQATETGRSDEHTSELQSLMRNSYAVFC